MSLCCLIPSMSNSRNIYSQHPLPPRPQTLPLSSLPSPPPSTPPPPHSSSLHKSSGCILKGAKIFTLSKVVKGFCVHTGADKEEAPSAWPKENCWNKSAHTKTQRDNGAGAGPDPETETHCAPEHTDTYTQSARLGTKSAHRLIFIFWSTHCSGHTVSEDQKHHNSPCVQPCSESHAWNQTNNKKKQPQNKTKKIHRWFHMGECKRGTGYLRNICWSPMQGGSVY